MKKTLIVPMVNNKSDDIIPLEFRYDNMHGDINCVRAISGIDLSIFTDIYFILLQKHEDMYHVSDKINVFVRHNNVFNNIKVNYVFLSEATSSQSETIYNTIKEYNIEGPIFIKDADNRCELDAPVDMTTNVILVYSLENVPIVDPQHKSYVSVDDQNFITNTIEKRIISSYFNCGGYVFEDARDFIEAYNNLIELVDDTNHMYVSHIIYWLMLNKNIKFRPIEAVGYEDFEIQ